MLHDFGFTRCSRLLTLLVATKARWLLTLLLAPNSSSCRALVAWDDDALPGDCGGIWGYLRKNVVLGPLGFPRREAFSYSAPWGAKWPKLQGP